jgi:dinuclear metal center YbgI/SA1388 family protein
MATIKEIYDYMDSLYPFSLQEEFDNCGLNVGNFHAEVTKCALALDITDPVIDEAAAKGAQLIVTHHPVIFDPLKSVKSSSLVYKLIQKNIGHIASHTSLDKAIGGANDVLAQFIGLKKVRLLNEETMFGRIGVYPEALTPEQFAEKCKTSLGCEMVKLSAGNRPIKTAAVNTGAGSFSLPDVIREGADAFLTGEIKLNEVLLARKLGITIVEAGHFETENMVMGTLIEKFSNQFKEVEFFEAESNVTMWKFM